MKNTYYLSADQVRILGNILRVEGETLQDQVREGFMPQEVFGEDMTLERYEAALDELVKMFPEGQYVE